MYRAPTPNQIGAAVLPLAALLADLGDATVAAPLMLPRRIGGRGEARLNSRHKQRP